MRRLSAGREVLAEVEVSVVRVDVAVAETTYHVSRTLSEANKNAWKTECV